MRVKLKSSIKDQKPAEKDGKFDSRNKLNNLYSTEWIKETVSVWTQKGLGASHKDAQIEKLHPAPFSFQDVGRLIRFFSKEKQIVLDPFCGVASTLKACAINNRKGVGIELNKKYVELGKKRLAEEVGNDFFYEKDQKLIHGDAVKEIKTFKNEHFDFIVTSPPYWAILNKIDHKAKQERIANGLDTKYSNDEKDFGNIKKYSEFVNRLSSFFNDCARVLKSKKYLCIIVSDFRNKDRYHMFHADLANELEKHFYQLKGITILYQRHKRIFPYGYPYSYVPNIHHQYILIFQKKA